MDIQRLRNLTTGALHTEMQHIYDDLEFLSGATGIMTHMIPNVRIAMEPWLHKKITDPRFWNGKFDPDHTGEFDIEPMCQEEKELLFKRYKALPHPFAK